MVCSHLSPVYLGKQIHLLPPSYLSHRSVCSGLHLVNSNEQYSVRLQFSLLNTCGHLHSYFDNKSIHLPPLKHGFESLLHVLILFSQ